MKLEWFRKHKKFVYYILLPVVGGGMAFFGLGTALRTGVFSRRVGPSISYQVAGKQHIIDPAEVLTLRLLLARYYPAQYWRGRNPSSDDVAIHTIKYQMARAAGFDAGTEEMKERLTKMVKFEIQQRDGTPDTQVSPTIYNKLLNEMQMTNGQFERMTREVSVGGQYDNFVTTAPVNDPELFIQYNRDKEVVRLRYKEFKSEDFMSKAEEPTEDKIKSFYNETKGNKDKVQEFKDFMLTKPKMSADLLYYDPSKLPEPVSNEADLKAYYERMKRFHWKEPAKPGETNAKEEFKPFDAVKTEVEQKWKEEQKKRRPQDKLMALKAELDKAEKAYNEDESKKPEAERKPFDLAGWAKKNDLTYWTTPEQTEDEYTKGKKEVGASNAEWVQNLFFLTKPLDPRFAQDPSVIAHMNERNKKMLEEFSYPYAIDPAAPEKGFVIARKKKYVPEEVKPLTEIRDAIASHLKVAGAVALARKEAAKVRDEWAQGNNLPPLDSLEEVSADANNPNGLALEYFDAPKAVGEVLPVGEGKAPAEKPEAKTEQMRFYVGFAVERQLPTWTTFHNDSEWDREQERSKLTQAQSIFLEIALRKTVSYVRAPDRMRDPPLFENYRGGGVPDDGDY